MTTSDALFRDLRVYTALIDRFGFILTVNEQWKAFVDRGGLVLPSDHRPPANHGIGENYLRFCAFADPLSPRLITGISQLLAGQTDAISIVYQRPSPVQNTSIMLFGFPCAINGSRAALLHIDVTAVLGALVENRHPADVLPAAGNLEIAISSAIAATRDQSLVALDPSRIGAVDSGENRQPPLSRRQWEVLSLMTSGLTNVEIARRLGLSPNTIKIHVSGILSRLGLPSRTQAVYWALTQGRPGSLAIRSDGR